MTVREMPEGTGGRQYDLEERLLNYSVRVIRVVDELPNTGNHVAGQLLRSGTSPSPNHAEAQSAESRGDFVHKMRVCLNLKELRETKRWLLLIRRVPLVKSLERTDELLQETEDLIKIFVRSVRTAETRKKG
jgi:four helix bundle protein